MLTRDTSTVILLTMLNVAGKSIVAQTHGRSTRPRRVILRSACPILVADGSCLVAGSRSRDPYWLATRIV